MSQEITPQFLFDSTRDGEEYDQLLADCPWGSFYHSRVNIEMICRFTGAEPQVILQRDDRGVMSGMAWCELEGPKGLVANALPFFGSYGEAVARPDLARDAVLPLYRTFLDDCRHRNIAAATVITSPFAENGRAEWLTENLSPDTVDQRLCQMTLLPDCRGLGRAEAEEQVLYVLNGRARTAVRKARKQGVTVRPATSLDEARAVAKLHADNIGGKGGRCKPSSFFDLVWQHQQSPNHNAVILVAEWRGQIIGGVVMFEVNDAIEYHTTGMDMEHRAFAPLNAIVFEEMVDGAMRGLRYINFGGTWKSQEGIYRFKASFGAEDHHYQYMTWLFDPILLHQTVEQLATGYPGFFVVPYDSLRP